MRSIQRRAHESFFQQQGRYKGKGKGKRSSTDPGDPGSIYSASEEMMSEFAMSFNHPAIPLRGQDRQERINQSHITLGTELAPDMPPEYEIYRHQEDGWEHLISFN